jgi:ADP-ribose pyrophosphatase
MTRPRRTGKPKRGAAPFPRRHGRRVIYRHPWIDLYRDRVRFPGGRWVDHHVLKFHRPSVAVVAEDARGRIVMVRAYRYVTGKLSWEVPAGRVDDGETFLAAARREAREESGYDTTGHRALYSYHPVNGISDKVFHVVRCRTTGKPGGFDVDEVREVRWFTRRELTRMIRGRNIADGYTLTALLLVLGGW